MTTLALHRISKRFGDRLAVRDVDLEVQAGEFFSLLGPSGCGKTTLLRIMAGFESPTEGTVHLDDRDITGTPPRKRGIGMVFQNYALFPHMTVFQNVAFGLRNRKLPKSEIVRRVESILESVHLKGRAGTPVPELSGGEQQRVAVARALVVEPAVLLMDEPLSNLDIALRLSTRQEIRALQKRTGITTVYVTHDQSEAMSLSDRIAVMEGGRIVQVDSPPDIYERPRNTFVAKFLGGAHIIHGTYDGISQIFAAPAFRVRVPRGPGRSEGSVDLVVKPDSLVLHPDGRGEGMIQGRVIEREYLGFTTSFLVDAGGTTLRVTALSSGPLQKVLVGDIVDLEPDWSKITFIPSSS